MVSNAGFSRLGKVYLWSVIVAGFAVIGHSIHQLLLEPVGYQWFILAGLTLISGSATVKLPTSYASISISETFVITTVLLYGPAAGTVIVCLDALVISFWLSKRHDEPHRALFNISAPAVSAWLSAHVFFGVARVPPLVQAPAQLNHILPALAIFAITYFALNSWLITFVISLERRLNPITVWTRSFVWLSLNYFGGASVAILFVGYNRTIDLGYVGVIVPLLLVLWFTFRTAMARVEDADKHVTQLNKLYLSTIETLAMAIDAKDQVTHGHIRRVQGYAINLAREIGVRDDRLLKAIEAAALLHDMGKLAVPEYILNKPGKLTDAEFAKMKLHASVGAEILSAIDFPYPVVPIVRHHHENWDGTGYPDGLRGTDIPIGARILSVVDCFDALTSDRPYRPRLSDSEAITVLAERRGKMYDPLVVDTFVRVHLEIAPESAPQHLPSAALNEIASARKAVPPSPSPILDEITASSDEMLTLYELARALGSQTTFADAADLIAKHLRRLIPSSLCVFFMQSDGSAEIEAVHVIGEGASPVKGLRIEVGQRLSGWVAANRQTIVNSDPVLDLGDVARHYRHGRLHSCISTPLINADKLIGVLSLYSREPVGFNEDHRRIIEAVAQQVSQKLYRSPMGTRHNDANALPKVDELERVLTTRQVSSPRHLVIIDIWRARDVLQTLGAAARDQLLLHASRVIRGALRPDDTLFTDYDSGFLVLTSSELEIAEAMARRVSQALSDQPALLPGGIQMAIDARLNIAAAPADGSSLRELIAVAKRHPQKVERETSIH